MSSQLYVSFKMGSKIHHTPFSAAVRLITNWTKAEQAACDELVKSTKESVAGFWSEVLGGAEAPVYVEWLAPISRLRSALSAYNARHNDLAIRHLRESVALYNLVHRKWYAYKNAVQEGGHSAVKGIDIAIDILKLSIEVPHLRHGALPNPEPDHAWFERLRVEH